MIIRIGAVSIDFVFDDAICDFNLPFNRHLYDGKNSVAVPSRWAQLSLLVKDAHIPAAFIRELLTDALLRQKRLWVEFEYQTNDGPFRVHARSLRPTVVSVDDAETLTHSTLSLCGVLEAVDASPFSKACASAV